MSVRADCIAACERAVVAAGLGLAGHEDVRMEYLVDLLEALRTGTKPESPECCLVTRWDMGWWLGRAVAQAIREDPNGLECGIDLGHVHRMIAMSVTGA